MKENGKSERREDIFSKAVRAGKRTYFFDVKETRNGQKYITITESKKRFNQDEGKFYFEKHKIFLYKEDFEKFTDGLKTVVDFIETGVVPEEENEETQAADADDSLNSTVDVSFEDLGNDTEEETKE
jgi:phosphomannomutase